MLYISNHFVMPGLTRHPVNNCFYWITHTIPGVHPTGQLKLFKSVDESHPCDSPFRHPFGMSNFAPGEIVPADLSGFRRNDGIF
jgi:hypothetical protein